MKHLQKKAESLAGIIVWIFILWLVILWTAKIIGYSSEITNLYKEKTEIQFLTKNAESIAKAVDLSAIVQWTTYYIFKDVWNTQFTVSTNAANQYIDALWNFIASPTTTFNKRLYSRSFVLERRDTVQWVESVISSTQIKRFTP
jgi:hypothetical protein